MIVTSDIKLQETLRRWASYLVVSVLIIAIIQLFGLSFGVDIIARPLDQFRPMNHITAVGIIMLAVSFLLRFSKTRRPFNLIVSTVLAVMVLLGAIVRFLSFVLKDQLDIKILFNRETISTSTSFCAVLASVTLLLMSSRSFRKITISHFTAAVIFLFAIFSMFVNCYHAQSFTGIFTVPMAFFSAVCFLLFSLATLFANPDKGLMKQLTTPFSGSIAARKLIPPAVIFPFLYGFIRLYGEWAGLYNKEFATSLSVLAVTITCLVFIIYNARVLNERDIESKEAEAELTETNYFLNTVLDNIPNTIFVKDAKELRFFRYNKAGEELLGYSRSELIGKNDYDFFPKEQADFFTMKDREALNGDSLVDIPEEPIKTKNGDRWIHTRKIPMRDENGKPVYLLGIAEDITEKRKVYEQLRQLNAELEQKVLQRTEELSRSEERFRKLLENNFEAISLYDGKFIPFYRSPAADRITGWTTEERIKAGGNTNEIHPDDREKHRQYLQDVLDNPGKALQFAFRTKHKDGHYIWLEGFMMNMLHDKSLNGIVANFRDGTGRREAEEEINKLTIELRQLLEHIQSSREEERKYIAREIHDELGQRLTALKIDVSMMRKKIPMNASPEYFTDEINSAISQIDQSIESVKRIATDLRPEILDHHGIIAAVKWQAEKFENITGVKCKLSYMPDDLNLEPESSAVVYRTVQETLTNIARHAEATAVSILIELDAEKLLVEIKDNGKGIDEEKVKSMKSLGLIGIRERVNHFKGTLSITGRPGKGTVVSINIPVRQI